MTLAKGPWKIVCAGTQWGIAYKGQPRDDSDVCGGSQYVETWKDDAAAIAAVPEMVAALEQIEQQLDYGQIDAAIRIARKALAVIKARWNERKAA